MNVVLIIKTQTDRLQNLELITFHEEFNGAIKAAGVDVHQSARLVAKHDVRLAAFDAGVKKIVKSPRTKELQKADRDRDDTFRGLVRFNKAQALHDSAAVRAASERVKIALDSYGNVAAMNYEKETGAIENLVQDLKSARFAADVTAVGLTPWVLKLEERNNTFKSLLNLRDQERGSVENLIVVKEARTKLNNIYARIRNRINSEVDDEEANPPLEALITQLNFIAKRFNTIVAKRDAAGKNGGGEVDGEEGAGSEEGDEGDEA